MMMHFIMISRLVCVVLVLMLLSSCQKSGQNNTPNQIWSPVVLDSHQRSDENEPLPSNFLAFELDVERALTIALESGRIILPKPDSTFIEVELVDAGLIPPSLQERYPEIRSFTGISTHDPSQHIRIDFNRNGFYALFKEDETSVIIGPYTISGSPLYFIFTTTDFPSIPPARFGSILAY